MPPNTTLRAAQPADFTAITALYAHHVAHGTASFELQPPTLDEMLARAGAINANGLPYQVAERAGEVLAYAYATPYRPRPAYRFTVESSVYVRHDMGGRGLGSALMGEVIAHCEAAGYRQMLAVIGDSHNHASIALHQRLGFARAGVFEAVGFKFGRWLDTVLMQRALGSGASTPAS